VDGLQFQTYQKKNVVEFMETNKQEKLIGWTIPVLDHGFVRLIDWMGTDSRICEAARLSYKSPSKGEEQDKKLLFYLYKMRHTSPFEQCVITFNIRLPLFVQGQMVRHRTQRLNQVSARYSEMKEEFYIPTKWRKQDIKNKQGSVETAELNHHALSFNLQQWNDEAFDKYRLLLSMGVAREMARMVLPQNLYTEIYSQWDLHNLMHFFSLRLDEHAQWEIRQYAQSMFKIFEELYPWCSEAYHKFKLKMINTTENIL
jgi:thymidylate synthase (FAD)